MSQSAATIRFLQTTASVEPNVKRALSRADVGMVYMALATSLFVVGVFLNPSTASTICGLVGAALGLAGLWLVLPTWRGRQPTREPNA